MQEQQSAVEEQWPPVANVDSERQLRARAVAFGGFSLRRALQLTSMLLVPILPAAIQAVYPGPLEQPQDRAAFIAVYNGPIVGVLICFTMVTVGSLVFDWDLSSPREWPVVFGVPVLVFSVLFSLVQVVIAYGFPASLRLPVVPAAAVGVTFGPAAQITFAIWKVQKARRLRATKILSEDRPPTPESALVPPSELAAGVPDAVAADQEPFSPSSRLDEATGGKGEGDEAADPPPPRTFLSFEPSPDPSLPPVVLVAPLSDAPPRASLPTAPLSPDHPPSPYRKLSVTPPPYPRLHMAKNVLNLLTVMNLVVGPMWGYIFLFALFSSSAVAQVIISLVFSLVSFASCYGILWLFRNFLSESLPNYGGQALVLLFLLHMIRFIRLMGAFRASSYAVLAFGVLSDLVTVFAPLLLGQTSRALAARLGRAAAVILRPFRRRRGPPAPSGGQTTPVPQREALRLAREGGRALFFLQALASMMASVHFILFFNIARYGPTRILFPFQPEVLPADIYVACVIAAGCSVVLLPICLAAARVLARRAVPRRAEALEDGFALGFAMVDTFGHRITALWLTSTLVSMALWNRVMNIGVVVFPDAFLPSPL